jgi:DNA invertase Pin-like site-specific DNA recombinase
MAQSVAYYRVSTNKQGILGLGMEAQKQSVEAFAKANDLVILHEYCEVESGGKSDREQLWKAIDYCKRTKAILIIAKLDRLSRSVSFVSKLMDSKVEFKCVDMPQANTLMLHIMAAFAQYEREQISKRTSAAIQAKIAQGKKWGTAGQKLADANKDAAMAFAGMVKPIFQQLYAEGYTTVRAMMAELNTRQVPGPTDGPWNVASVGRYMHKTGVFSA